MKIRVLYDNIIMAKIPLANSEVSLSSSSSSHESNDLIHNKEDINSLTNHVKSFRESLAKLKIIFTQDKGWLKCSFDQFI